MRLDLFVLVDVRLVGKEGGRKRLDAVGKASEWVQEYDEGDEDCSREQNGATAENAWMVKNVSLGFLSHSHTHI